MASRDFSPICRFKRNLTQHLIMKPLRTETLNDCSSTQLRNSLELFVIIMLLLLPFWRHSLIVSISTHQTRRFTANGCRASSWLDRGRDQRRSKTHTHCAVVFRNNAPFAYLWQKCIKVFMPYCLEECMRWWEVRLPGIDLIGFLISSLCGWWNRPRVRAQKSRVKRWFNFSKLFFSYLWSMGQVDVIYLPIREQHRPPVRVSFDFKMLY